MSFLTAEEIQENVVSWIADQLEAVRRRSEERARQPARQRESWEFLARAKNCIRFGSETPSVHYRWVDRDEARRQATDLRNDALAAAVSKAKVESPAELAQELCALLGAPSAATFTNAWIGDSRLDEGDYNVEEGKLGWVIGVAAAVVVAIIVILVRRGRIVEANKNRFEPSDDFKWIIKLTEEDGPVGAVARSIQSHVREPWSWSLLEGAKRLDADDRRTLLARLSELGHSGVKSIAPAIGARFDHLTMNTAGEPSDDDVWVVTEVAEPGFTVRGRTLNMAQVAVATLDSRVLLDEACPVGRLLSDRADELIPGGNAGTPTWRATWGLSYPEDLRELLDEDQLDTWRQRMMRELNGAYGEDGQRQLALTGQAGAIFEPSTMDVEGAPPVGDAVVREVVARDGVAQHGLACPGGSPLLLAVVRVNSPESA
jgi:hypothetical protein